MDTLQIAFGQYLNFHTTVIVIYIEMIQWIINSCPYFLHNGLESLNVIIKVVLSTANEFHDEMRL